MSLIPEHKPPGTANACFKEQKAQENPEGHPWKRERDRHVPRDEVPLHIYIPEEGLAMEEGHIQACQRLGTGAMHRARGGEIQSKEEKTPGPQISRLFKTR